MNESPQRRSRLALAGIASPIVLSAAVILVALQRPDYSHVRQTISELGTEGRRHAVWMNWGGIIPAGVLVVAAARALSGTFGRSRLARIAAVTLAFGGGSFVVAGLFPWVGRPGDLLSTSSRVHLVAAVFGFFCLALSPLLFGLQARRDPHARGWTVPCIVASCGVFVLAFWPAPGDSAGALQRGALTAFYAWLVAASVSELRRPAR